MKCCTISLCKSCEPQVRQTHGCALPGHQERRYIRCPLCRQMEPVPFDSVVNFITELLASRVPRNIQEFSINPTPNFNLTPRQQQERDVQELNQLVNLQQRREALETQERERRIQQERERLQRQEREHHYGVNLIAAMRLVDPRRLFRRQRPEVQGNGGWIEEPVTPHGAPPGWIEMNNQVEPQRPVRVPNLRIPPRNQRRQARIALPVGEPRRSQPCSNQNCNHRTVFRCRNHPNVVCCRSCVCALCIIPQ